MNRNRSTKRLSKQSTISSISSHIPLMTTNKNNESRFVTPSITNMNAIPDVHSLLQPFPVNSNRDAKRSRTICQPKGTIPYTVGDTDTLEKVALRFNSTPSELLQFNKLSTRMVFPGQILFVPEKCPSDDSDQQQSTAATSPPPAIASSPVIQNKDGDAFILLTDRRVSGEFSSTPIPPPQNQPQQDAGSMIWSMARQTAARPGRAQRLHSNASTGSEPSSATLEDDLKTPNEDHSEQMKKSHRSSSVDDNHLLDDECLKRFIKVNVRLMTEDHQSVAGTLLVTPNAVMFDPDVLDPFVKQHGIDKYGLIIRMDFLAGIALYEDLTMYQHEATFRDEEKRKHCHSTSVKNLQHCPINHTLNTDEEQIHELMSSLLDKIDKELNPSISTDSCCKIFNASSTIQHHISINSSDNDKSNSYDNDAFLPIPINDSISDDSLQFSNDLFQSLDDYKHSIGILLDDDNDTVNKNFNRVPSQGCHLENCVPLDDFNKRFGEIDKLLYKQQQNYFAPQTIEIPHYLCIKTSIHSNEIPSLHARQYNKSSENVIDDVYGKKQLDNEYWFTVPKEKSNQLYKFFLHWRPERQLDPLIDDEDLQTNLDESKYNDNSTNKGFVLLATDDPQLTDDYIPTKKTKNSIQQRKELHYLKRQNTLLKEWEIISVDEIYRRFHESHLDDINDGGIRGPILLQPSTLINEAQSKQIFRAMPFSVHALNWKLLFSTELNGFSLNQLYRRSVEIDRDSPSLLIVKDVDQNIFGAFVPHQLVISTGFYGTGESFLFTFHPEFRAYKWAREHNNEFFVKGDLNSLGFGVGDGAYGLWIDGDLYHGRTCASKTFQSEQLSSKEDFTIASIEVWTLVD